MSPNSKKHVAVMGIKGLPAKGGAERVAEAIIGAALAQDYQITVYGKKNYLEENNFSRNLEIIPIQYLPGKHLGAFSFGLLSALHALLCRNFDFIHLHCADYGYLLPLLRLRYKVIGTSHGAEYNRDKWGKFAKWFFRLSEALFIRLSTVCTSVSKMLAEHYSQKYLKKVFYIPNGIDEYEATHSKALEKYHLPSDYILFCASRIIPSKGCDLLLEANRQLNVKLPIVIIGNKDIDVFHKEHLMSLAEQNVIFINFISSKDELFEIIKNCRVFVFPSTYEAMSMILLEVASLKKAIVCSNIPENLEAIGDHAVYFESGQISSLRNNLEYALTHSEIIEGLAESAYSWVMQHRRWQKITKSYLEIYKGL